MANLATQLFEHGRIVTTEAKARRLRPLAEKLITKAKRGDIHSRRLVLTTVRDKGVVHTLFTEIAPGLADREGGYTRITKVGPRKGDNAPMALIEIVTESVEDGRKARSRASGSARRAPARPARSGEPTSTVESSAEEPASDEEVSEQAPAEELSADTEARTDATGADAEPSDDTSAEEAAEANDSKA